jgi:hypothetical protein
MSGKIDILSKRHAVQMINDSPAAQVILLRFPPFLTLLEG